MKSNVIRSDVKARNGRAARFLMLWIAAVIATSAAFVVHLAIRFRAAELGLQVGTARREQRNLLEQKRVLALEAATLRNHVRVESIARNALEMHVPEPEEVVPGERRASRRRASGRVR